jgi:capsular exopolysaccharide synthesis family protein
MSRNPLAPIDSPVQPWTTPADAPQQVFLEPWEVEERAPELRDDWAVLMKRRWLAATFFLAAVGAALALTLLSPPIYSAKTVLLIEPDDPEVIDIKQVVGNSFGWDDDYYTTQHEILRSRSIAGRVVRDLQLEEEPAFVARDLGPVASILELALAPWRFVSAQISDDEAPGEETYRSWLVDLYLQDLWVEPVQSSRLVRLYFHSTDPELAARTINAHAKAYIEQGLEFRNRASKDALAFLEEKLVELRARVERSEASLNRYARQHGIVSLDDKSNVVIESLVDLNGSLSQAEADRIAREADALLIRRRRAESLPAVIQSPLVRTLKQQLAELEGEYASMSRKFKAGYPRRAELEARLRETRGRLEQEIRSIVDGIESSYLAAQAHERELRRRVQSQKDEALRLKDAAVEYAILEHDAETSRQLYDSVRQRIKEMGVAAELRASNIFVIDRATPPLEPAWPRSERNLALGTLLGLMGGVVFAFAAEYLDKRLRSSEEVERFLRLPSLGAVPKAIELDARPALQLARGPQRRHQGRLVPARRAHGSFEVPEDLTEAYRSIRTNILLSQPGEPPRTLLFSSGGECEGKTTTVLHTATMFAQLGARVLVIDADLRRPACHRILGVDNRAGLTEVLTGQPARMQRVHVHGTPLFFLGSGATPPNPTELLGSDRMKKVLEQLREKFEYILIDAPPIMPISDAVVLSTLVDGVVLVIDQQRASPQAVKQARARLAYARATMLGFVLNRADSSDRQYAEFRKEAA